MVNRAVGDQLARSRLLLAQRAGYLPREALPPTRGAATQLWHGASKNLARDSRAAGYPDPMQYLRAGLLNQGTIPQPRARVPLASSTLHQGSNQAMRPSAGSPFQMFDKYQLPRV